MKAVLDSGNEVELTYVGEGTSGVTYHGMIDEKPSLVKVLREPLPQDADPDKIRILVQALEGEVEVLQRIDHPRVPKYYGGGVLQFSPTDKRIYSAREFKEGKSLEQVIAQSGVLPETDATRILIQMLELLSVLHSQSIPVIHRDIKPENIILHDGESSLIDFGIATQPFNTIMGMRTLYGTPGYMAPEQAMGKAADQRTDVYGLGTTLIRGITNLHPGLLLDDRSRINFRERVGGRYSENFLRVLEKMTQNNARERYQSAGEVLADLTELPLLTRERIGEILRGKGYSAATIDEALSRTLTDTSAFDSLEQNLAQKEAEVLEVFRRLVEFRQRTKVSSLIIPDTITDYASNRCHDPLFKITIKEEHSGFQINLDFTYLLRTGRDDTGYGVRMRYDYTIETRRKVSTLFFTKYDQITEGVVADIGEFENYDRSLSSFLRPFTDLSLQTLFHNAVELRQHGQTEQINYRFILPALLNMKRVIYQGLRERGEQLS